MPTHLPGDVAEFLDARIDSVPQMETLQLLHGSGGHCWTVEEIAARLYLKPQEVAPILRHLHAVQLAKPAPEGDERWCYAPGEASREALMQRVSQAWRTQLIAVTRLIHAKASHPVLEFARAFDLKKDR